MLWLSPKARAEKKDKETISGARWRPSGSFSPSRAVHTHNIPCGDIAAKEMSSVEGAIVLKNIRRDIPALKPLAANVILLQRQLIEAVQRYQVSPLLHSL